MYVMLLYCVSMDVGSLTHAGFAARCCGHEIRCYSNERLVFMCKKSRALLFRDSNDSGQQFEESWMCIIEPDAAAFTRRFGIV